MTRQEAENNHWRCIEHKVALEESRGVYYCPICAMAKLNMSIARSKSSHQQGE